MKRTKKGIEEAKEVIEITKQAIEPTANIISMALHAFILVLLIVAIGAAKYALDSFEFTGDLDPSLKFFLHPIYTYSSSYFLGHISIILYRLFKSILSG